MLSGDIHNSLFRCIDLIFSLQTKSSI